MTLELIIGPAEIIIGGYIAKESTKKSLGALWDICCDNFSCGLAKGFYQGLTGKEYVFSPQEVQETKQKERSLAIKYFGYGALAVTSLIPIGHGLYTTIEGLIQ